MNELKIIDERIVLEKEFRIYGTFENPLFLAKDVANWIEYDASSINKMLAKVDGEEKVRNIVPTLGGNQEMWLLTEEGLYEVLMQSRKPIAKEFKKQVKQILKTIRKTGGYVNNDEQFINTYLPFADDTTKMLFKSTLETVRKQNELIQQQKETIAQQEDRIETMQPSVDMAQKRRASDGLYTYTDCQKKFTLKQGQVGCFLKIKGYVHWDKKETTKLGDDTGFVRQYGEEYPNIGVTELGLKYLEDNIDELRKSPCKLPKKKQEWLDMNK